MGQRATRVAKHLTIARRRSSNRLLTVFTGIGAIATALGVFTAAFGLMFVREQLATSNEQIEVSARFSEQSYLQDRGQDFLSREYASRDTLSCIYDWWFPSEPRLTIYGERCRALREGTGTIGEHHVATYAATMLYVEEALMYLVEESRMACQSGVRYARELDIWRNDVSEDVSGVFSFYMLYRFADPEMDRYFSDTPLASPDRLSKPSPSERLRHFIRMAKIDGVSILGICRDAEQFASALAWKIETPAHVSEVCGNGGDRSHLVRVGANEDSYCDDVHGVDRK